MKKLSRSEQEIMEYLWKKGEVDFDDLAKQFANKEWARSTISVFMHRLSKKGYTMYYRRGRNSLYRPLISQAGYERILIDRMMKKTYGVPFEHVIGMYCGVEKLSEGQLSAIREALERIEKELKTE